MSVKTSRSATSLFKHGSPSKSKRKACNRCVQGKRACDEKRPCSRCSKLGKTCHYDSQASSVFIAGLEVWHPSDVLASSVPIPQNYAPPILDIDLKTSRGLQTQSSTPGVLHHRTCDLSFNSSLENRNQTVQLVRNAGLCSGDTLCNFRYNENGERYDLERVFIGNLPVVAKRTHLPAISRKIGR